MKKVLTRIGDVIHYPGRRVAAFVAVNMFLAQSAMAAGGASHDLGTMMNNGTTLFQQVYKFLQVGALVGGLGAAVWGLFQITFGHKKRQQQQESMAVPVMAIIGGGILASVTFFLGSVNSSLFGGAASMDGVNSAMDNIGVN